MPDNGAVIDRVNEEIFNRGNLEVIDELFAEDFVEDDPLPGVSGDREGFKELVRQAREAFPDLRTQVHDQIVAGDKVVERWTTSGTHEGEFLGIPPTHRRVEFSGMDISRLENGRLVEHWTQLDVLGLLQQLGAIPSDAPR